MLLFSFKITLLESTKSSKHNKLMKKKTCKRSDSLSLESVWDRALYKKKFPCENETMSMHFTRSPISTKSKESNGSDVKNVRSVEWGH